MRLTLMVPLLASVLLAGCSDQQQDLRDWMAEASKDLKPSLKPLPPIRQASVVTYQGSGLIDPFKPAKLEPDKKSALFTPDANRRREPLEAYPLESLRMVGVMMKKGQVHAIIAVDKTLHQVKVGNYLGQNYGKITAITESDVSLKELVEDASGEWTERISTLQLQEQAPQEAKK
ncbi:MAG: pilus assembly protein PilP [Proteobacteria bacterium]|nr:pilus assembly protein PilP [Pseudomonadota bacterium]